MLIRILCSVTAGDLSGTQNSYFPSIFSFHLDAVVLFSGSHFSVAAPFLFLLCVYINKDGACS